ncbi:MAG: hypothetical protein VX438_02435 [Planctomycetota bacterium]|nr:hypothetical protein [Planctomycetota bacterium]
MNKIATLLLPLIVFSVLVSGCGGGATGGPSTVKVSGNLTIGGTPAAGVQITLAPIGEGLQPASGNTDDTGYFELITGQTGTPGAMIGKYKVVLVAIPGQDDSYMEQSEDNAQDSSNTNATIDPTAGGGGKVPAKYRKKETSDKEVEITGPTSDLKIEIN